ncbi:MAG: DNA primase [bacterium]|nr:DNA primase [bacterium]
MTQNNSVIEQIKDRIDIIDIISEYVALKKNGRNYLGLCPFHKEKTPSFSVNAEKGIFKCFGCGESGDAISFLMKINHQSFLEVMENLAYKYGLPWSYQGTEHSSETSNLKKQMLEANKLTAEFFNEYLKTKTDALEYLEKRACDENIIKAFGLGFAPDKTDALLTHLKSKGFEADFLEKAGLVSQRTDGKGYIDKFRNRIIVPVYNEKGDVVAFGARIFKSDNGPKYINSQETLVYSKSKTLYGLYQAKEHIRENDAVLIMEGYFDVITAHANGFNNAVASCGTSLTEQHVKILNRYMNKKRIYLAYDADEAGQKATKRNAQLIKDEFEPLGDIKQFDTSFAKSSLKDEFACEIRVVATGSGKDPDEFIKEKGADAYRKCIENAPLLIDYQINSIMKNANQKLSAQEKSSFIKEIAPILAQINNRIVFSDYVKQISLKLGIDVNTINSEIKTIKDGKRLSDRDDTPIVTISSNKLTMCQKNLLSLYFINADKLPFSWLNMKLKEVNFTEANLAAIKQTIDELTKDIINVNELIEKLMAYFSQNVEIKSDLADIIYAIDDKVGMLNQGMIEEYIAENIRNINKITKENETKKLFEEGRQVEEDDAKALELQQELMEKLKLKSRLEYSRLE